MEKISQLNNDKKENSSTILVLIYVILLFVVYISISLTFKSYTVLISCDNGYIYEKYGLFPLEEVKKLEKTLNTGDNNIDCEIEMFAR